AALFLVFAHYLVEINTNVASVNMQLVVMESDEGKLLNEVQSLHRTIISIAPAAAQLRGPQPGQPATDPGKAMAPSVPQMPLQPKLPAVHAPMPPSSAIHPSPEPPAAPAQPGTNKTDK
ncbi:MAG TPA: hypothetical protein VMV79_03900, partial [Alphaproteobacteria bacterium]|nr:hypothetical protein [Alphaproteobacteria bacterium]